MPIKLKSKTSNKKKRIDKRKVIEHEDGTLEYEEVEPKNVKAMVFVVFVIGVLLIFATYAWFSVTLNVRINTFRMVVTKNSGLTISLDGINFDYFVDISDDILIDQLYQTYPNHASQWAGGGLVPVSSPGVTNPNSYFFDIYSSGGVMYRGKDRTIGYLETVLDKYPNRVREFNRYIAFDLFFKNDSSSPVSDNLYFNEDTSIVFQNDTSEQMEGLMNSLRVGIVKVGSVPLNTDPTTIQNIQCNNNCRSIIYEHYSTVHTELAAERAAKYNVTLIDGYRYPTYAYIAEARSMKVPDTVSGSPNLDMSRFMLQQTIVESDFDTPLFEVPSGVTKTRVYIWIEGQDIDSLETDSEGAELDLSIGFRKDTRGNDEFMS